MGKCQAKQTCPFGEQEDHFATPAEARSAYEASMRAFTSVPTIGFNRIQLEEVWHVGSLKLQDRKAKSYEGSGISVSVNPEEWQSIARLRGETWTVRADRYLNFAEWHSVTEEDRASLRSWAVTQGWIEEVTAYRVTYFDDEWEQDFTLEFDTFEEAEVEAEAMEVEVESVTSHRALPAFPQERGDGDPTELVFVEWVSRHSALDGVWWDDAFDPQRLSCPRGVIVRAAGEYSFTKARGEKS